MDAPDYVTALQLGRSSYVCQSKTPRQCFRQDFQPDHDFWLWNFNRSSFDTFW